MNGLFSLERIPILQFRKNNFKSELIRTFRVHSLFIAFVLSYVGCLLLVASIYNARDRISLSLYSNTLIRMTLACILSYFVVYGLFVMLFLRPEYPVRHILNNLRVNYIVQERLINALPVFLFMPVFLSAFTSFKTMIPVINPFSWDATFARWDAIVHGGIQPWKLLHSMFGHPFLTFIINIAYNTWFFVMYLVLFWQVFSLRNARLRMQFLLTYLLSWMLIGTLAAIVFSSAGPCFYGRVVKGENIYQPLMEYLSTANERFPIWALHTQEMLWKAYGSSGVSRFNGISAMPSMHMSMALIFAMVAWRRNRYLGIALAIFSVLIMIGCVHLGWHYAIDGYLSIILTLLIWWFVARLLDKLGGLIHV